MSDLYDLYQEVILDHGRRPRNAGCLEDATHIASGNNPLCGDQFEVYLRVEGDIIQDVRFDGVGCAISTASASLMSENLKGMRLSEFPALFEAMHGLVTGESVDEDVLGKLVVFGGVQNYPMRVKCATLAWHTSNCLLYTSPSPRDVEESRMPSSA